jgi:O-antigen/teichoic acid export membrane protein
LLQNQTYKVRQFGNGLLAMVKQESIWIPVGRILALLASVLAVRVLTELVSPEQFGRLSLVTGFISLFSLVLYTSLGKSANRFIWDYVNQKNGNTWVSTVLFVYVLFGLAVTLILWGSMALGFNLKITNEVAVWAIPIYLVAGAIATGILGMLNMLHEHRVFITGTVVYAWLTPGLAILIVLLWSPTAESILIGYAGSAALMILGVLWVTYKRGLFRFTFDLSDLVPLLGKLLRYSAPFIFVSLFYWIQVTANRYVLDFNLGIEQVGVFVVAATIARIPIQSIESIFGQIHQPVLFQKIGQQNGQDADVLTRKQAFSDYMVLFLIITLPVLWFTIFGAGMLMRLLAGQQYWAGAIIIPWVALAEFLRAFIATTSMAFEVERRPRSLIMPIAAASFVTLSLTYLLSNLLGIVGAGIALALGSLIWLILIWIPASRLACWRFSWPEFFKVLLVSVLLAGAALGVGQMAANFAFFAQSALFISIFALGYLLYAGRKLLG